MQKKYVKPKFKLEIVIHEDSLASNSLLLTINPKETNVVEKLQVDNQIANIIEW
jgi:hypothetical protein